MIRKDLLKQMMLIFLLLAWPLVMVYTGFQKFAARELAREKGDQAEELEQIMRATTRLADPVERFTDLSARLRGSLLWGNEIPPLVASIPSGALSVYLFNAEGKRVKFEGFPLEKKISSERFLQILRTQHEAPEGELNSSDRALTRSFLEEPLAVAYLAKFPGTLVDLHGIGLKRLAGWFPLRASSAVEARNLAGRGLSCGVGVGAGNRTGNRTGAGAEGRVGNGVGAGTTAVGQNVYGFLVILVECGRLPNHFFLAEALRSQQRRAGPATSLGFIHLLEPEKGQVFNSGVLPKNWKARLLSRKVAVESLAGHHFGRWHDIDVNTRLFGFRLFSPLLVQFHRFKHLGVLAIAGGLCLLLTGILYCLRNGLSLRIQLILLFGYLGLMSALSLALIGIDFRESKEADILNRSQDQALRVLARIDDSFFPSLKKIAEQYNRFFREKPADRASFLDFLRRTENQKSFFAAYQSTISGKVIDQLWFSANSQVVTLKVFIRNLMATLGQQVLRKHLGRDHELNDVDPSYAIFSDDATLRFFLANQRNLFPLVVSSEEMLIYLGFNTFAGPQSEEIFTVVHDRRLMEMRYLAAERRKLRGRSPYHLLALPRSSSTPITVIPANALKNDVVRHLRERVQSGNLAVRAVAHFQGAPYLVSAVPGKNLRFYDLFLLTPLRPSYQELAGWELTLMVIGLLTLVFGLLLAGLFVDIFLRPVDQLSRGVENLVALKVREPMPRLNQDELGDIAEGLQKLMSDLGEVQAARVVQDQLMPESVLRVGNLACCGISRTPGMLGESFFLRVPLKNGGLAVMVGDVPEKGMMTGLLHGMYMTAVRLLLSEKEINPGALLTALKTFFAEKLSIDATFSAFVALVDPVKQIVSLRRTGQLTGVLAPGEGHPQRLVELSTPDRSAADLDELQAFPAGSCLFIMNRPLAEQFRGLSVKATGPWSDLGPDWQTVGIQERVTRLLRAILARQPGECLDNVVLVGLEAQPEAHGETRGGGDHG